MRSFALRVTAIYLTVSALWIVGSDRFVEFAFPNRVAEIQTYKGLFFVGGTALLLFVLIALFERKERVAKREMAAARARAELASSAKTVFLSHMSHELRTPLNAIAGFSEIMRSEMFGPIGNERYRTYVDAINDSSAHLSELLGEVLDLSQIESGDTVLDIVPTDMSAELRAVASMFATEASKKGIDLDVAIADGIEGPSNPLRLRQIVTNLLSNAIRHTDRGSVRLTALEDQRRVVIEVADTGSGIPPEQLENIRAMLALGSPSYARGQYQPGRNGLGLVISSRLAGVLGGRMEIASMQGDGTRVTLTFDPPAPTASFPK